MPSNDVNEPSKPINTGPRRHSYSPPGSIPDRQTITLSLSASDKRKLIALGASAWLRAKLAEVKDIPAATA